MQMVHNPAPLSSNGPDRRDPFNHWFRYPAGFSNEALKVCFEAVPIAQSKLIIDPFAGASTAGILITEQGGIFRGIEAHPLIAELSNLKFQRPEAWTLREHARALLGKVCLADPQNEHELVQRCFEDGTLAVLAGLRDLIEAQQEDPWQKHLRWALLATLRDCASVKVGWPYQLPAKGRTPTHRDAKKRFLDRINSMIVDLEQASSDVDGRVVHGDSRDSNPWKIVLDGQIADGCITSPPYLNNFDYADATRLELYFLKYAASWREMTEVVRSTMMVASTQQTNRPSATVARESFALLPDVYLEVAGLVEQLSEERKSRQNGKLSRTKEYDHLVLQYFADMRYILEHLSSHLRRGSKVAMIVGDSAPYGVYVDTPGIIARIAVHAGLETISDDTIRLRGQKWSGLAKRHNVALAERVLVLRKP